MLCPAALSTWTMATASTPPISMEPSDRGYQGGFGRSQRLLIFYWDVLWSGRLIPLRIQWQIPNKKA